MQVAAADDTERVQFLAQYGWTVSPTPAEVYEVEIPQTFDEIYEMYNDLQRSQGFDLSAYRGMRVKRWSYDITNYPDGYPGRTGQPAGVQRQGHRRGYLQLGKRRVPARVPLDRHRHCQHGRDFFHKAAPGRQRG